MFNWLKKLFGSDIADTPVIAQEPVNEEVKSHVIKVVDVQPTLELKKEPKKSAAKPKAKKAPAKKVAVDLDSMNKTQLLEEAKTRGVKVNASLKKEEVLERIKNG